MATVTQRKDNGRYLLSFVDPFTKKRIKRTLGKNQEQAEIILAQLKNEIKRAEAGLVDKITVEGLILEKVTRDEDMSLVQLMEKHKERSRTDLENSESTIRNNELAMGHLIRIVGNKVAAEVTDEDILKFKRVLLKEMRSRSTAAIYFRHVKSVFSRSFKWRWIPANPFFFVENIKEQTENRINEDQNMSIDEVKKLLKTIEESGDHDFYYYVLFAFYTGARRVEILTLRWEHINFEKKSVRLFQQKTKREIEIPLSTGLGSTIEEMGKKESGFIFQSKSMRNGYFKEDRHWHKDVPTKKFKKYIRDANLSDHYKLHSMRHTFSTALGEKGVPREAIQRLLGHANIKTTGIYDHSQALAYGEYSDLIDLDAEEV